MAKCSVHSSGPHSIWRLFSCGHYLQENTPADIPGGSFWLLGLNPISVFSSLDKSDTDQCAPFVTCACKHVHVVVITVSLHVCGV